MSHGKTSTTYSRLVEEACKAQECVNTYSVFVEGLVRAMGVPPDQVQFVSCGSSLSEISFFQDGKPAYYQWESGSRGTIKGDVVVLLAKGGTPDDTVASYRFTVSLNYYKEPEPDQHELIVTIRGMKGDQLDRVDISGLGRDKEKNRLKYEKVYPEIAKVLEEEFAEQLRNLQW